MPNVFEVARFFCNRVRESFRSCEIFFAGAFAKVFSLAVANVFARAEFSANSIFAIFAVLVRIAFFFIDIVIKLPFATRQKFESE